MWFVLAGRGDQSGTPKILHAACAETEELLRVQGCHIQHSDDYEYECKAETNVVPLGAESFEKCRLKMTLAPNITLTCHCGKRGKEGFSQFPALQHDVHYRRKVCGQKFKRVSERFSMPFRRFDDIVAGKAPRDGMIVMRDVTNRSLVNKIQDLNYDDVFREYFEYKPLLDIVESFTGPSIMAMHSMLIAKPPDAGSKSSRHPPHQDLYYFPFRPADRIVATWTAIESCDTHNGCLYVSPGSHLPGHLLPHGYPNESASGPVNKLYHEIQDLPDSMRWVDLEVQPGDTLFFHPLLVHGSGVNRSKRTRKAISCHYAAADCEYTEIRGTVQEPIRSEVMEIVSKRYPGMKIDYEDLWRAKSKLVRGVRSSL